jgi:hypothetical protein
VAAATKHESDRAERLGEAPGEAAATVAPVELQRLRCERELRNHCAREVARLDNQKSPRELYDDFIKLEWQDIFRTEIDVRLDNGSRYVPNSGSQGVQLLRKGVNAFDEAIRIWSDPSGDPDSGTQGYDRIVDQAGIEFTWEWFLIDETRPWADAVPLEIRGRIEADLSRRDRAALARAKAKAEREAQLAEAEDDNVIATMNARRQADGKPALTMEQEASVRENRRRDRARELPRRWVPPRD